MDLFHRKLAILTQESRELRDKQVDFQAFDDKNYIFQGQHSENVDNSRQVALFRFVQLNYSDCLSRKSLLALQKPVSKVEEQKIQPAVLNCLVEKFDYV